MAGTSRAGGGAPAAGGNSLSLDERAELEALRHEVTALRGGASPRRRHLGWRAPVATLMIVLGCLLAPLSVLGIWTANQVSDTNRYVTTVTPLIHDPAIQHGLTDKITATIVTQINVQGLANQTAAQLDQRGMPRAATLLHQFSGSIASAVQGFVHNAVARLITSPAMANAWVQVNTVGHQQLVAALSGRTSTAVTTSNGEVVLNLAPFIKVAQQDLARRGLTLLSRVPTPSVSYPLFPSKSLVRAQTAYRLINDLKIILPIASLLLIGLGVYIARGHRRALIGAGLGFAASMFVLAAGLLIVRGAYLNAIPPGALPSDAAASAYDILVRFIRLALRGLLLIGLLVAGGAFLTGPSVTAVAIRSWFGKGLGWIRHQGEHMGVSTGPVGRWTYARRRGLRIGVVALLAVIFVFQGQPTVPVVIGFAVVLLVALGLIELIGRPPAQPVPSTSCLWLLLDNEQRFAGEGDDVQGMGSAPAPRAAPGGQRRQAGPGARARGVRQDDRRGAMAGRPGPGPGFCLGLA
jgi:hypothetical protein